MTPPTPAAVHAAMQTLGVTIDDDWASIRRAYRDLMRRHHPDVVPGDDATERAASLNQALATLTEATDSGRIDLAALPGQKPSPAPPSDIEPVDAPIVLRTRGTDDVFVDLLDAAYDLGDVVYIDAEAGLIQVLVEDSPRPARLLINVDTEVSPARAAFTLDADDEASAPSLPQLVDALGALLEQAEPG